MFVSDCNCKIGAMDFAKSTSDTTIHGIYIRKTKVVLFDNFLSTQGRTESAGLAPFTKEGDAVELFFFGLTGS